MSIELWKRYPEKTPKQVYENAPASQPLLFLTYYYGRTETRMGLYLHDKKAFFEYSDGDKTKPFDDKTKHRVVKFYEFPLPSMDLDVLSGQY